MSPVQPRQSAAREVLLRTPSLLSSSSLCVKDPGRSLGTDVKKVEATPSKEGAEHIKKGCWGDTSLCFAIKVGTSLCVLSVCVLILCLFCRDASSCVLLFVSVCALKSVCDSLSRDLISCGQDFTSYSEAYISAVSSHVAMSVIQCSTWGPVLL